MKQNQVSILFFIGLIIISASIAISHFTKTPDFISGLIMGIGIGILLIAFKNILRLRKSTYGKKGQFLG
jgi:hypothetical protein